MNRIGTTDGLFHEGNPAQGQRGTKVTDLWLNNVQEELLAIIEDAGLTPDSGNVAQILAALRSLTTRRVENVAALRGLAGSSALGAVETLGYYSAGDGGGNKFVWIDASAENDNGGTVIQPTAVSGAGRWIARDRCSVTAKQFGLKGDGITNDKPCMDNMLGSSANCLRFTSGVYQGTLANGKSNRTFVFDEGSIIDGVAHIATGTGPDYGGQPTITWVDNVRVIGTLTSTQRIGTYYARKLNADKLRITEINSDYVGQTAVGGSRGVHIYHACHDFEIGEIVVDSTVQDLYALGIDHGATLDDDHRPTDIHIGKLTIRNNTQAAIVTADTKNIQIDSVVVESHQGIGAGFSHYNDDNMTIGSLVVDSSAAASDTQTIYLHGTTSAKYDSVTINNAKNVAFRCLSTATAEIKKLSVNGYVTYGAKLDGKCTIGSLSVSGGATGLAISSTAAGSHIDTLITHSNTALNATIGADNISIRDILSYGCPNGYGLLLTAAVANFRNDYIEVYGCVQGVRCLSAGPVDMGIMNLHDCTTGFAGSGMDKFSYRAARYNNNGTNCNVDFEGLAGFAGKLAKLRVGEEQRGDASITIAPPTAKAVQAFGTPLTANRTITLSSTGASPGDAFEIVRTAAATGAYTLDVGGLKTLAVSTWCRVVWSGVLWRLTAYGAL